MHLLHDSSRLEILRIRNRMDDEYAALSLTAGYRDCNVKIRLSFELDNTSGAVSFKEISKAASDGNQFRILRSCFELGAFVTKDLGSCHADSNRLHFVCELQLILQV